MIIDLNVSYIDREGYLICHILHEVHFYMLQISMKLIKMLILIDYQIIKVNFLHHSVNNYLSQVLQIIMQSAF